MKTKEINQPLNSHQVWTPNEVAFVMFGRNRRLKSKTVGSAIGRSTEGIYGITSHILEYQRGGMPKNHRMIFTMKRAAHILEEVNSGRARDQKASWEAKIARVLGEHTTMQEEMDIDEAQDVVQEAVTTE